MKTNIIVRTAQQSDIVELKDLFQETVLMINGRDYSREEVEDWASCGEDLFKIEEMIKTHYFIVAINRQSLIVGFSSITSQGYLHSMFVHKDFQGRGIATLLLKEIERHAIATGIMRITSEVSITARPFFEKWGYTVEMEQRRRANRLCLTNYRMAKGLTGIKTVQEPIPACEIMNIRQLNNGEYDKAVTLSLDVFTKCGTADFDADGLETFKKFITNRKLMSELTIFGAFDNNELIGIVGTKHNGAHISLFFISPDYHRKGIGRKLFDYAFADQIVGRITVNSSSYAVRFYESLGFSKTAEEQETGGLKYTPMVKIANER